MTTLAELNALLGRLRVIPALSCWVDDIDPIHVFRRIDCDLAVALLGFETIPGKTSASGPLDYCIRNQDGDLIMPGNYSEQLVPRLTRSADAALAFFKDVVPGWRMARLRQEALHSMWSCHICNDDTKVAAQASDLANPALAIISATLRAKIKEMEKTNDHEI